MKRTKMKIANILSLSLVLSAVACDGDADFADLNGGESQTKTVVATDASGKSLVELKLTSTDARLLAEYGPGSFVLEPIDEKRVRNSQDGQSREDVEHFESTQTATTGLRPLNQGAPGKGEVGAGANPTFEAKIVREQLAADVSGYRIVDTVRPNFQAFEVVYRYTYQDCAMVTRVSTFNNVYASIESQQVANGAWSTIAYRTDLQKNQPLDVCDSGSYQLKARIERRNPNDYEFSGHN